MYPLVPQSGAAIEWSAKKELYLMYSDPVWELAIRFSVPSGDGDESVAHYMLSVLGSERKEAVARSELRPPLLCHLSTCSVLPRGRIEFSCGCILCG